MENNVKFLESIDCFGVAKCEVRLVIAQCEVQTGECTTDKAEGACKSILYFHESGLTEFDSLNYITIRGKAYMCVCTTT